MDNILHRILNPHSVAIVGASRKPDSFSHLITKIAIRQGYAGKLYLINPGADTILGLPCYPNVLDAPTAVDVALIALPKQAVGAAIGDCVKKGVSGIVILSSGFAEQNDGDGRKYQEELEELIAYAKQKGTRIIGPNTLGYYCAPVNLDLVQAGFIKPGNTALLTQSGNLTTSLTLPGSARGLGFRYVVDIGNQADLQAHDFIRYFREDPGTKTIAVHIEGLRDGRLFMEEVRETVTFKPVLVIKSGRTEKGANVVASHTASIAGNDDIFRAAMAQCGAIEVDDFTGLTSALLALNQGKLPRGNKVCIISQGGGDCAITSDACIAQGLDVPELSESAHEELRKIIPRNGSAANPVDLAGWRNVVEATEIALNDDRIDGVLVVGGFAGYSTINPDMIGQERQYVMRMCELISAADKPVLIYTYFAFHDSELIGILKEHHIPLFLDHHDAVKAMAAMVTYRQYRSGPLLGIGPPVSAAGGDFTDLFQDAEGFLLEPEAKKILDAYHLPYPEEGMAQCKRDAVAVAARIGYPVVLKIVSRNILHKSDAGCVQLGLHDAVAVEKAFDEIIANANRYDGNVRITGVLVGKMDTEEGIEVIIGGLRDPVFGPVIMFGLGGIFVEALKDVSFRICPIDETEAVEMIREIRGFAVLNGIRGKPAVDLAGLKTALVNVSRMLFENPAIREVDLNPVKVHKQGLSVLDVRILNGREGLTSRTSQMDLKFTIESKMQGGRS